MYGTARGSFAELAVVPVTRLARRPGDHLGRGGRRRAGVGDHRPAGGARRPASQAGDRVLVIGASGGVGSYAVQLAVDLGAHVTGVCGPAKADLVRSLGAEQVVDHTTTPLETLDERFDVVLDIAGHRPVRLLRGLLTERGVPRHRGERERAAAGSAASSGPMGAALLSPFVRQRLVMLVASEDGADLAALTEVIERGGIRPALERTFAARGGRGGGRPRRRWARARQGRRHPRLTLAPAGASGTMDSRAQAPPHSGDGRSRTHPAHHPDPAHAGGARTVAAHRHPRRRGAGARAARRRDGAMTRGMSCAPPASLAAGGASPRRRDRRRPPRQPADPDVVVVGAGLAGLRAAHWLWRVKGIAAAVYEGAHAAGGRCWTLRDHFPGYVVEHGGALINTDHNAIATSRAASGSRSTRSTAAATRVGRQVLDRRRRLPLRRGQRRLGRVWLAVKNALKAAPYPQTYDSWTRAGRALDDLTVDQWLDANVPGGLSSRFAKLMQSNAVAEYGLDPLAAVGPQLRLPARLERPEQPLADQRRRREVLGARRQRPARDPDGGRAAGGHRAHGHRLTAVSALADGRVRLTFARVGATVDGDRRAGRARAAVHDAARRRPGPGRAAAGDPPGDRTSSGSAPTRSCTSACAPPVGRAGLRRRGLHGHARLPVRLGRHRRPAAARGVSTSSPAAAR